MSIAEAGAVDPHARGASAEAPADPSAPWLALLRAEGALLDGHFRLSSGLHAERYIQCQTVMGAPRAAEALARALAERFAADRIDVVLGPALGAIVWAHELARALGCRSVFAERVDGRFALRRGQALAPGARVLVAENVVTTGGSAREVFPLIDESGAKLVGVAAIVDRSPAALDPFPGHRFESLVQLDVPAFAPDACPRCLAGQPIASPGSSVYTGARRTS